MSAAHVALSVGPWLATWLEVEIADGYLDPEWIALVEARDEPESPYNEYGDRWLLEGERERIAAARILLDGWDRGTRLRVPREALLAVASFVCDESNAVDERVEEARRSGDPVGDDRHLLRAITGLYTRLTGAM